jgi:hypothetical protein
VGVAVVIEMVVVVVVVVGENAVLAFEIDVGSELDQDE